MPHAKDDARIHRTYTLLFQALSDLMLEKTFDEIRVTDLCEKAGVHRSTFYAHFEDKLHLLTFGIQELMEYFVPSPTPGHAVDSYDPDTFALAVHRVFRYFRSNQRLYTLLFLDPRNASAKTLFRRTYIQAFDEALSLRYPEVSPTDRHLCCRHFIGGLLTVVDWWLETDAALPPEELASQFVRLIPSHIDIFSDPARRN